MTARSTHSLPIGERRVLLRVDDEQVAPLQCARQRASLDERRRRILGGPDHEDRWRPGGDQPTRRRDRWDRPHGTGQAVVDDERTEPGGDGHRAELECTRGVNAADHRTVEAGDRPERLERVIVVTVCVTTDVRVRHAKQRRCIAAVGVGQRVSQGRPRPAAEIELLQHRRVEPGLVETANAGVIGREWRRGRA